MLNCIHRFVSISVWWLFQSTYQIYISTYDSLDFMLEFHRFRVEWHEIIVIFFQEYSLSSLRPEVIGHAWVVSCRSWIDGGLSRGRCHADDKNDNIFTISSSQLIIWGFSSLQKYFQMNFEATPLSRLSSPRANKIWRLLNALHLILSLIS